MPPAYKYTMSQDSLTIINPADGKTTTVQRGAANFDPLRRALFEENWNEVANHLTVKLSLATWAKGEFTVQGEKIFYKGEELPDAINQRAVKMAATGESPEPLFKFWARLQKNPSYRSVQQLYRFIERAGIPLTTEGTFLAYKMVTGDYMDVHSRRFKNTPGALHEMDRNKVSDDPNTPCHEGFHVGHLDYARGFHSGGRIVICEVDPADVVCVPYDYGSGKMRVCRYKVIGNHNGERMPSTIVPSSWFLPEPEEANVVVATPSRFDELKEVAAGAPGSCPTEIEKGLHLQPIAQMPPKTIEVTLKEDPGDLRGKAVVLVSEREDREENLVEGEPNEIETEELGEDDMIVIDATQQKEPPHPTVVAGAFADAVLGSVETAEVVKFEKKAEEKPAAGKISKKKAKKKEDPWAAHHAMGPGKLMELSIHELRQYANKGLAIVGASKIPQGKTGLIRAIMDVRGERPDQK